MSMLLMAVLAAGVIGGLDHNIVTPEWLQQNLDNPYVVVVEIGSSPVADRPHIGPVYSGARWSRRYSRIASSATMKAGAPVPQ